MEKVKGNLRKISGKKKQHKHKLFGPDFPRTFLTLTPKCPGAKKFLPTTGGRRENALFGADVHYFSARTSMTRRVCRKTLYKKKFALIFCPLNLGGISGEQKGSRAFDSSHIPGGFRCSSRTCSRTTHASGLQVSLACMEIEECPKVQQDLSAPNRATLCCDSDFVSCAPQLGPAE